MENTSCGSECAFIKCGVCDNERGCPNFIESWWIEGSTQQPKLIKDCSSKRLILQQQLLQTRLEGVQQALEQSRNEYHQLSNYLKNLIQMSKSVLMESESKQCLNLDLSNEKYLDHTSTKLIPD